MMKKSSDGEQERSREYGKQRNCGEKGSIRELRKRVIGSPGEEVVSLHLATTPGQEIEEEILADETWKEMNALSSDKTISKLWARVQQLQGKLIQVTEERSFQVQQILESKLLKVARKRLTFNETDVHASILCWDNFFKIYSVKSDQERFYAIEQILPERVWKAMNYCSDIKFSYTWLVAYLKDRYDPVYQCHNMRNRRADEFSCLEELEDVAMEAAKCPQEQLIKYFMLESVSEDERKKMGMYLLLPMKEFKFQLKLLLQGRKPCQVVSDTEKKSNESLIVDEKVQIEEAKIPSKRDLKICRVIDSKGPHTVTYMRERAKRRM